MRFEDGFDPEWREILSVPVSENETRDLLERLASPVGIDGRATISAICEATGSTPQLVSRILADIRGVSWQKEFGDRLQAHSAKLLKHEVAIKEHSHQISELKQRTLERPVRRSRDREIEEEMQRIAEERIWQRKTTPYVILFFIVAVFIIFASFSGQQYNSNAGYESYSFTTSNRTLHVDGNGNTYVRDTDGRKKYVSPTPEEMVMISRSQSRGR